MEGGLEGERGEGGKDGKERRRLIEEGGKESTGGTDGEKNSRGVR